MMLAVGAFALGLSLAVIVTAEVLHRRSETYVDDEPGWADDAFCGRRESVSAGHEETLSGARAHEQGGAS
jgi:hypothetical protein